MNIADKYIQYVKTKTEAEPEKSWDKILFGFKANCLRTHFLPNKNITKVYQKLEDMMMNMVAESLSHKKSYIWGNIFAPCELIHSFGLNSLSIECLSCYVAGYHLEDFFIDFAQSLGFAPTLCSYHKTFIGAVESGTIPPASYAVTTSLSCDGNLNTFRYLQKKNHVPFTLLDVPYTDDEASVNYLASQLETMVQHMEEHLGRRFQLEKLKESLRIENETRKELIKFYELAQHYYYPGELIHQLYMMMGTHLLMGTQKFLDLIRFMNEEIQTYPPFTGKRILWIHLIPYYQESLKQYFNNSKKYQLLAGDIIFDFTDTLVPEDPFRSLARKLIKNVYNGSYSHKAQAIGKLTDMLHPDAVIHFCHWGCKQASGGSLLLKEAMKERNIPMLILDGDGVDQRNSHDGQIKTRLEAFLEMIVGEIR